MGGSGKGTLANLMKEYLEERDSDRKVLSIETGALLREFAKTEGHTQDLSNKVLERGGLFPSFLPVHLWGGHLVKNFTGNEHLVLDGLARRASEVPVLDEAMKFYGREVMDVVVLVISREVAVERLHNRKRFDDIEDKDIKTRLDWYEENTEPGIVVLKSLGHNIHMIDGSKSIEEVDKETKLALGLI